MNGAREASSSTAQQDSSPEVVFVVLTRNEPEG